MNKTIFAKIFGGLCILLAILALALDGATFIVPIGDIILKYDSNFETAQTKLMVAMLLLVFIGLLPLVFGLFSYYLAGGIGDSWISRIFIALVLGIVLLLPIIGVINTFFLTGEVQRGVGLFAILLYLSLFLSPIIFSIAAFFVGNITLWKRFIPIIAFVLWILIPIILGGITIAMFIFLKPGQVGFLYKGAQEATIPQWLMLGSIAWALLGLPAFMENKKADEAKVISLSFSSTPFK